MSKREPESCPSDAEIERLASSGEGAAELQSHIESCERCNASLAHAADSPVPAFSATAETVPDSPPDPAAAATRPGRALARKPDALGPKTRVGRFILEEEIGRGGMGVVYRAIDTELDRVVALKFLSTDNTSPMWRSRLVRRFQREGQAMAKLSHPNVVQVFEVGEHRGHVFLAMELIDGVDLSDWLKDESLTPRQIVEVFVAAGEGLCAAHSEGLIHRDFKPGNVLIARSGQVKVTDFGLARAVTPGDDDERDAEETSLPSVHGMLDLQLTQTGALVGTLPFMSPEQLEGRDLDARSDIYSFGVSLFYALHGVIPFDGADRDALLAAIEAQEVARDTSPRGRVPGRVSRAIQKSLRREPSERFESLEQMLVALSPARSWRLPALATVVVSGAAIAGLLVGARGESAPVCDSGEREIASVWQPSARQALASAPGVSAPVREPLMARLGLYTRKWANTRNAVCRASKVDGTQSQVLLQVRMACLDDARLAFKSTLEGMTGAETAREATELARSLPALEPCASVESWASFEMLPDDPQLGVDIRAARSSLAAARGALFARVGSERSEQAAEAALAVLDSKQARSFTPLLIEAADVVGQFALRGQVFGGSLQDAESIYRNMLDLIELRNVRDPLLRARAYVGLIEALASEARLEEVSNLGLIAQSAVNRAGDPALEARLHLAGGRTFASAGQVVRAEDTFARGLAVLAQIEPAGGYATAVMHLERGKNQLAAQLYTDAIGSLVAAREELAGVVERDHPLRFEVAYQLGLAHFHAGEGIRAAAMFELALPGSRKLTSLWRARALAEASRHEEARSILDAHVRERETQRGYHGTIRDVLSEYFTVVAATFAALGDDEEAGRRLSTGLIVVGRSRIENPPRFGNVRVRIAAAPIIELSIERARFYQASGQLDKALEDARFAVKIADEHLEAKSLLLAKALVRLAVTLQASGQDAAARPIIWRAGRIHEDRKLAGTPPPPTVEAEMSFVASRIYHATRDASDDIEAVDDNVRQLAETAERSWRMHGGREAHRALQAKRWLDSLPP